MVPPFRVAEGLRGKDANVRGGDPLHGLAVQRVAHGGHEYFGGEAGFEVVHEGDGAQDRPAHLVVVGCDIA